MPALTIPSPTITRSASPTDTSAPSEDRDTDRSNSRSPGRPPVSPLTPTTAPAKLAPLPEPSESGNHVLPPPVATFRQQPPSLPISESENPDAIALRSAISLLQLQREKSKRDLKALQDLKTAAISDPQAFAQSLQAQRSQPLNADADVLTPTLSNSPSPASGGSEDRTSDGRKDSAGMEDADVEKDSKPKFASLPQPQNIIRCPPVNWAKYHVVGEPLDKMHEEQKKWPGASEPPRPNGVKMPPHAVASPYSPFTDGISGPQATHPQRAMKGTKKSPS